MPTLSAAHCTMRGDRSTARSMSARLLCHTRAVASVCHCIPFRVPGEIVLELGRGILYQKTPQEKLHLNSKNILKTTRTTDLPQNSNPARALNIPRRSVAPHTPGSCSLRSHQPSVCSAPAPITAVRFFFNSAAPRPRVLAALRLG